MIHLHNIRLVSLGFMFCVMATIAGAATPPTFAGIAFVGSSVTGQGSSAGLPAGTRIYPSGTTITGSEGCPTTRYRTDGLIVAVIDYDGQPTAASLAVVRQPATGGRFQDAPYYLDLNSGRTLQTLGPIFDNGSYAMQLTWGLGQAQNQRAAATFVLARSCPPTP
jgi:hypothetical protein